MTEINIPEEAVRQAIAATKFDSVIAMAAARGAGAFYLLPDIADVMLKAAAPLIVAAELDRLANTHWNRNLVSVADLRHWLRDRAAELRDDKPECTCDYGAVTPGIVEPPTTDPDCPEHGGWHDTRFGPPSRHAGTYEGCLACESRQRSYDPLLRPEASAMDPEGVTAQPMDGRCEP